MNLFDKILVASRRSRELARGDAPKILSDNGPLVTALNEIDAGKIGKEYLRREPEFVPRKKAWNQK
jgi:DNA-directed RNA polymerase subunit omega